MQIQMKIKYKIYAAMQAGQRLNLNNYTRVLPTTYAPNICCHALPPSPGDSGDFAFWSSKSLLNAPPCGDCSLVKPLLFSNTVGTAHW